MHIEVVRSDKEETDIALDNQTVAELMRVYLTEVDGVKFAAWRKEHPSKPLLMHIVTSGISAKKAISEAVSTITKELDGFEAAFKKK